ncbi:hypothetical protein F4777DRAFT_280513 [Nemania sp. FL0916]|nr:hypothetical protein F4777DRAFT_280513 [Nemania sp. FL0916]
MTCFIPSQPQGTSFSISLHTWKSPDISQFSRNYSKHPELVKFEARVLIDGRLVTTSSFSRSGPWPQLIDHSFEFTKNGDLETLKFPQFRNELLRQSYWNPADELGRIKIVISEGFPRDSLTLPMDRVKNLVAFSFQHAPLDILESSGIAWPNPAMWRRSPFNPTVPNSSQHHEDGPQSHLHSPRRRSSLTKSAIGSYGYNPANINVYQMSTDNFIGNTPNTQSLLQHGMNETQVAYVDPFEQNKADMPMSSIFDWSKSFGMAGHSQATDMKDKPLNRRPHAHSKISASDISMPDYSSTHSGGAHGMPDYPTMNFSAPNAHDPDTGTLAPKVPTNTPTALADASFAHEFGFGINKMGTPGITPPHTEFFTTNTGNFSMELATSLTHSLLNQPHPLPVQESSIAMPAPEIKSRKENRLNNDTFIEAAANLDHIDMRKVSQSVYGQLGKTSRDTSNSSNSPPSQSSFSGVFSHRSFSGPEFGNDLTNSGILFTHESIDPEMLTENRIGSGSDKGIKRTRQFTPASVKAIDDEDEPNRNSPKVRNGLAEQVAEIA